MTPAQAQPDSPGDRERLAALNDLVDPCVLCPRTCRTRRRHGEVGFCGIGAGPVISSYGPHFGEEAVLVGRGGSGTVFLTGCNLGCAFCQNEDISVHRLGEALPPARLARILLGLERSRCENINFVTPTHQAPAVAEAVLRARAAGLRLPVVYNCGGYERVEVLRLLEGLVDIYMPDLKFLDPGLARRYTGRADYPEAARAALREMHRQVGDLAVSQGLAVRGLLVRHLVMPDATADGLAVLDFLADEISARTFVNVMGQYHPSHRADEFPELRRRPRPDEVAALRDHARRRGLRLAEP